MNKKVLSKAVSQLDKAKAPAKPKDIITDPMGQWKFPGQDTRIPGNKITMEGVPYLVYAQPNVGPGVMMESGKDYEFPDADYVDESPQMKKGGILKLPKMPKPSKKGVLSKAYSNSLDATNKLFTQHKLFEKVKSKKGKVFDPNANYEQGGEYIETYLADDEIEELRKGGYIVQDISVPSVGGYKQGGALLTKKVTCKKCGWKWDAADGGDDITTCHKCGGQGLVHAQKGVQVNKKGTRNPALETYMNRDMSQAYQIKNVPSDNTKVVKPVIKTSKPKPVLANRNEQKALAQHLVNTGAASRYLGDNYDGSKTLNEAMLEKVQQNPNIMNSIDKQEYQYLIDKEQKAYDKASPLEKTASFVHSTITDPVLVGSNLIEGKAPMLWQGMNRRDNTNPETQSFYNQASGANNNMLNNVVNTINPGNTGASAYQHNKEGNYLGMVADVAELAAMGAGAVKGAKSLSNVGSKMGKLENIGNRVNDIVDVSENASNEQLGDGLIGLVPKLNKVSTPLKGTNAAFNKEPIMKKGGMTNDYMELDLTLPEIKWYRSQGYTIEDIV